MEPGARSRKSPSALVAFHLDNKIRELMSAIEHELVWHASRNPDNISDGCHLEWCRCASHEARQFHRLAACPLRRASRSPIVRKIRRLEFRATRPDRRPPCEPIKTLHWQNPKAASQRSDEDQPPLL